MRPRFHLSQLRIQHFAWLNNQPKKVIGDDFMIIDQHFFSMSTHERIKLSKEMLRCIPRKMHFVGLGEHATELPTFIDHETGIAFKLIFGGPSNCGCSSEEEEAARAIENPPRISFSELRPVHEVTIEPFLMGVVPVLAGEYLSLGGELNGVDRVWANSPVAVTWADASTAASRLGFRLPHEREWEYGCRAGSHSLFPWGDTILPDAELELWMNTNFSAGLRHVANAFGLKGLFVGEWCRDLYRTDYGASAQVRHGEYVVRGGGSSFWPWQGAGEWVWCMPSIRMPSGDLGQRQVCGFRLVLDLQY